MKTVGISWLRRFSDMQGSGRSAAPGQAAPLSPEPCRDQVCPAPGTSPHPLPHGTSLHHCSSPAHGSSMSENPSLAPAGLLQALEGLFPPLLGKKKNPCLILKPRHSSAKPRCWCLECHRPSLQIAACTVTLELHLEPERVRSV